MKKRPCKAHALQGRFCVYGNRVSFPKISETVFFMFCDMGAVRCISSPVMGCVKCNSPAWRHCPWMHARCLASNVVLSPP